MIGGFPLECWEGPCNGDPECVMKGCKRMANPQNYKITKGTVCICGGTTCAGACATFVAMDEYTAHGVADFSYTDARTTWDLKTAREIERDIRDALTMSDVNVSRVANGLMPLESFQRLRRDPLPERQVTNRAARRARAAQARRK